MTGARGAAAVAFVVGALLVLALWLAGALPDRGGSETMTTTGTIAGAGTATTGGGGATPLRITPELLPERIMGLRRDDIAMAERGGAAARQAERLKQRASARIGAFREAYGGDGIDMSYGALEGKPVRLTIVNGLEPRKVIQTDTDIEVTRVLGPAGAAASAYRSRTVACTFTATIPLMLKPGTTPKQLRDQALDTGTGTVDCVRADRARNRSVAIMAMTKPSELTARDLASRAAAAIDEVWSELD